LKWLKNDLRKDYSVPLLLSGAEVESLLNIGMAVEACEEAFRALAFGDAINRPRTHTFLPSRRPGSVYMFKSMEGGVLPLGVYGIRLSSDHLQEAEREGTRRREKLKTLPGGKYLGLIFLFSLDDGRLTSIMPDSFIARMRTGAKNGVGAKYLARKDASVMGLLGCGWQAGAQLMAHKAVRPLKEVRVFSPTREKRETFAREMSAALDIPVVAVSAAGETMRGADIVVTATNATQPVLIADRLEPGMHLAHIQGRELDPEVVRRADVIVTRAKVAPSIDFYPQHLGKAIQSFLVRKSPEKIRAGDSHDLLEIIRGDFPGRTNDRQITLFGGSEEDGAVHGMLLAATAAAVERKAREKGVGRELPLDWFLEETPP
jgi:ornithine cyclodeaminase/alanine dehydrogenase-like protein (mu-crystallin family)